MATAAALSPRDRSNIAFYILPLRRALPKALAAALLAGSLLAFAQSDPGQAQPPAPIPPQSIPKQSQNQAPSYTFKVVTRMVIVEVVVRDQEDNPVRDLTAKDLQVSETIDQFKDDSSKDDNSKDPPEKDLPHKHLPEKIASLQAVTEPLAQRLDNSKGIVLGWLHKSFCALTGAYELSYYLSPESRKDGLHRISVTSSRKDLTIYFRPGYRIEADEPAEVRAEELTDQKAAAQIKSQQALDAERQKHPEPELARIACYDDINTTTFQLTLQKKETKDRQSRAYEFVVPASYFASLPDAARARPTQLDFSLCTFENGGHPLVYFGGTVQAGTTPGEYRLLSAQGFAHIVVFTPQPGSYTLSARLVVRDRDTGALGSAEIQLLPLSRDHFSERIPEGKMNDRFGSTTRDTPLALCGDVYHLPPWTIHLPRFSEFDAVAPIYATSLGVYSRFFTLGIPGVTSRTEWFGVNYWGVFGVDRPGKYDFDLLSDDGARVYVDEKLIVSDDTLHSPQGSRGEIQLGAGAHDIRISYFQGPRTEVALVLLVKPPGRRWRLFDTRDFPDPQDLPAQRKKLSLPEN